MEDSDRYSVLSVESSHLLKKSAKALNPDRRFLPSLRPLYPLFEKLILNVERKLTIFGVFIETLQLAALLVNRQFPWGNIVKSVITRIFYALILPFSDKSWIKGVQDLSSAFVFIYFIIGFAALAVVLLYSRNNSHSMPRVVMLCLKYFLHLLSGVLVAPIFTGLASRVSCDKRYTTNFWNGGTCISGFHGALFFISLISMVIYFALLYLTVGFCFDDMPNSRNLAARPRSIIHAISISMRVCLTILFQVLIGMGKNTVFAYLFLGVSLAMLGMIIFFLPYYNILMNKIRGMQWGVAVGVATSALISIYLPESNQTKIVSLFYLMGLGVLGGLAGFTLPLFRRNAKLMSTLSALSVGRVEQRPLPPFPKRLPEHDLVLSSFPYIEKLILGGKQASGLNFQGEEQKNVVLEAYLNSVFVPSDIEVACRFLHEFDTLFPDTDPSPQMLVFGARIHTKGIAKYPCNIQVQFYFAIFLAIYAKKLRMGLTEITLLQNNPTYCSVPLSFRMHHLAERLKTSLRILNTNHMVLGSISSEMHREIVGTVTMFWKALANGNPTTTELTEIADLITLKCEKCKDFYAATLETPTELLLINYSNFLRDVLLDEESADIIQEGVEKIAEERRLAQVHSKESSVNSSWMGLNWQSYKELVREVRDRRRYRRVDENRNAGSQSKSVSRLRIIVIIICGIIFILSVGVFIFFLLRLVLLRKSTQRIQAASQRNANYMYGSFLVRQVAEFGTDANYAQYISGAKKVLALVASRVFSTHYALSLGDLKTKYAAALKFTTNARVPWINQGVLSIEGSYSRNISDLLDLGFQAITRLQNIAATPDGVSPTADDVNFIVSNTAYLDSAFNYSTVTYIDQRSSIAESTKAVIISFFVCAIFLLMCIFALMLLFIKSIETSKESVINLFLVIPKSYVKALHQESFEKSRKFIKEFHQEIGKMSSSDDERKDVDEEVESEDEESKSLEDTTQEAKKNEQVDSSLLATPKESVSSEDHQAGRRQSVFNPSSFSSFQTGETAQKETMRYGEKTAERKNSLLKVTMNHLDSYSLSEEQDEEEDRGFIVAATKNISNFFLDAKVVFVLIIICFVLSCITLIMAYLIHEKISSTVKFYDENVKFYNITSMFYTYFSELTRATQQYIITGDLVHPQRYYNFVASADINTLFQIGIFEFSDLESVKAVVNIQKVVSSAVARQQAAMWLASSTAAYAAKISPQTEFVFTQINAVEFEYNYLEISSLLAELFRPFNPIIPNTPTASTNTIDGALSDADKMNVAVNLVFDDYYLDHRFLLQNYVMDFVASKSDQDEKNFSTVIACWYVGLICVSVSVIILGIILREAMKNDHKVYVKASVVILMCLNIVLIVILSTSKAKLNEMRFMNTNVELFAQVVNSTNSHLLATQGFALRIIEYGYESTVAEWEKLVNNDLEELVTQALFSIPGDEAYSYSAALKESALFNDLHHIYYYSDIAAQIGISVYPNLSPPEVLNGFNYNIELESNYQLALFTLDIPASDLYTNTLQDLAATTQVKKKKAITAVSGARYDLVTKKYFSDTKKILDAAQRNIKKEWMDAEYRTEKLSTVSLALGSIAAGFTAILLIYIGYNYFLLKNIMKQNGSTKRKGRKKVRSRTVLVLKLLAAVSGLIILFVGVLLLFLLETSMSTSASESYTVLQNRVNSATEIMIAAEQMWFGSADEDVSPYTLPLRNAIARTAKYAEELYLGNGKRYSGLLNINRTLDEELFGSPVYNYSEYKTSCAASSDMIGYSVLDFDEIPTDFQGNDTEKIFYFGTENVWFQFLTSFASMAGSYTKLQRDSLINPLISVFNPLATRSRFLFTQIYQTDTSKANILSYLLIVYSVILMIVIALVVFFVILPLLHHLVQEEEGSRLLIRMIPDNVRREVATLHDFFDNGKVNDDVQLLTDVCDSVDAVSLLVVNNDDRIVDVTDEALKCFLYSKEEMIGALFERVLSPGAGKAMTEHRNVVGTSRLKILADKEVRSAGMRSDGSVFPMEMNVREVTNGNSGVLYVIRLKKMEAKCETELARRIYHGLSTASRHPIIVMDTMGVIRVCNNICEEIFGQTCNEIVGNYLVSLLHHTEESDLFKIKNYFNVIQKENRPLQLTVMAVGKGKNEREVPLSVSLSAIVNEDNTVTNVVGTLIDLTDAFRAKQLLAATRAAIAASPVPVVQLDSQGNIIAFSPAAERSWGYPANKALKLRMNDLLHESDANRFSFVNEPGSDLRFFLGMSRALLAKRISGESFVVEARMKEMLSDDGVEVILCYFKDLSKEMEISRRNIMSQAAFDMCPVSVIVIDITGEVKGVNRAAEKLFRYRANTIVGQNVKLLMPDRIAERHDEFLERYAQTGVKHVIDTSRHEYAKGSDGRIFAIDLNVRELDENENRGTRLFVGYIQDISERFQMQRANEINDIVTQHCPNPIISIDRAGNVLSFNPAAASLFEYTQSEVIGKNVSMLMPDRYARVHDSYVQQTGRNRGRTVDSKRDAVGLTSKNVEIPLGIHVMELNKGVVNPIFVASLKDLSAKSKTQDECKLEEAVITHLPRSIIVTDQSGLIKFFSQNAAKSFGFPKPEMALETSLLTLMNYSDVQNREKTLSALLTIDSKEFGKPVRVNCLRRDGIPFVVNFTAKQVKSEKSSLIGSCDSLILLRLEDLTSQGLLQKSDDIHEELLHKFEYGTAELDADGAFTSASKTFLRELHFGSASDVLQKRFGAVINDETGSAVDHQLYSYANEGIEGKVLTQSIEFQFIRHDHTKVHLELIIRPTKSGNLLRFLVYLRNIDATFSFRNHQKLIRDIIYTSPIPALMVRYGWKKGVGLAGEDGTIYASNNAMLEQFNFSLEELLGKHLQTILTPTGRGARSLTERLFLAVKGDKPPSGNHEEGDITSAPITTYAVGMRKDRSTFPVRVSIIEFFDVERNHSSVFMFIEETTSTLLQQVHNGIGAAAAEVFPLAIVGCDGLGQIVLFSEQAEKLFICTEGDVLRKSVSVLVDGDTSSPWVSKILEGDPLLRREPVKLPRIVARKTDGSLLSLEITLYEAEGGSEHERLFISFIRDTTAELADNLAGQLSQVAMMAFSIPYIITSSAGVIELVNDAFSNLVMYSKDELLRNTFKMLITPAMARRCDQYAEGAEDMNKNSLIYTSIKRKDGREIPVEMLIGVYRSHGKTSMYAFVTSLEEDVELKKEHTLTEVIATVENMAVLYVNREGIIKSTTASVGRFFEYTADETMAGQNIRVIFPSITNFVEFAEANIPRDRNSLAGTLLKGRTKMGGSIFCEVCVKEVSTQGDEISYTLLLHSFVTSKDQNERDLKKALAVVPPLSVVVHDINDVILHVNPEICAMFGYSSEELIGNSIQRLISSEHFDHHRRDLEDHLREGKQPSAFRMGYVQHVMGVRKDGQQLPIMIRLEDVDTAKGKEFYCFISEFTGSDENSTAEKVTDAILTLYPLPVMVVSNTGKVLACSSSAAAMMRLSRMKLIGTNVSNFLSPYQVLSSAGEHDIVVNQTKEKFHFQTYVVPSGAIICNIYSLKG